jgi:MFS family permease
MNVCNLLPQYVNKTYPGVLSNFSIGVVMAVNPLSFFVATLTIGHHMQSFGRKNAVLVGVIVMACATFMFSCSVYSRGVVGFYVVSLIANIF